MSSLCFSLPVAQSSNDAVGHRDILLRQRDDGIRRIWELHRAYDTLQYPILFPYGTDGWSLQLKLTHKVTQLQFYCFHLMTRPDNYLLHARKLLQQYMVDVYAKIEAERLSYLRREQGRLRADSYHGLRDALFHEDGNPNNVGQRVILPSSFTGGPRYMHERQQDALVYVQRFGRPDLFITVTTNPKWPEITENLAQGQKSFDRPDIVVRVFRQKLIKLMSILKEGAFGPLQAWLYSVEFQKRGLPHAHILLWLQKDHAIRPEQIDSVVVAEIPIKEDDPELHDIVTANMIHGPCGPLNPESVCMKNGSCTKKFPKEFLHDTEQDSDCYPKYRRRTPEEGGGSATIKVNGSAQNTDVDSRWVVPYNPWLLRQMGCHVNVELCSSVKCIKYVLKYVHKGSDQATFRIEGGGMRDEISDFLNARYVGSTEAAWRIFEMPMHERYPPVLQLAVHLENGQRVYFTEETAVQRATAEPPQTTLTAFFKLCEEDPFAKTLLYTDVPKFYTWSKKTWKRRKKGKIIQDEIYEADMVGRLYTVSPSLGECFFLRLLLHNVKGPASFAELRLFEGQVFPTYREACLARGLLQDDSALHHTLEEAATMASPKSIRSLFAVILIFCQPSSPLELWNQHYGSMTEDYMRQPGMLPEAAYNLALDEVQKNVLAIGGQRLSIYGLPEPDTESIATGGVDYQRETSYDVNEQAEKHRTNLARLTADQKEVFTAFTTAVREKKGSIYFLDAPGGCGKTFLIETILSAIRSEGKIALATASSGLAATLLSGGRTVHSMFKVPLNLQNTDAPMCSIKKGTSLAKLISDCSAIIVDEAPMLHRKVFEAMDRSFQDIRSSELPMGGIPILLCGDFRQILPVVPSGTRANIVNASIKKSHLWVYVKMFHLTTNMRVQLCADDDAEQFSNTLMSIGDGTYPCVQDPDYISLGNISTSVDTTSQLIQCVYPDFVVKAADRDWLAERAILCPLNEMADKLNKIMVDQLQTDLKEYRSVDSANSDEDAIRYPSEFLNSIEISGLPPHKLLLKLGTPVMIMRSINPPALMNGTRCIITKLMRNLIEVVVASGPHKDQVFFVPRITLQPSDTQLPFLFTRKQFPLKPCFAITFNKAQGQSLKTVGLDLPVPVFTHGMLYVGISRVGSKAGLFVHAPDSRTRNIVYSEVLH